jgi:hypothetical protein
MQSPPQSHAAWSGWRRLFVQRFEQRLAKLTDRKVVGRAIGNEDIEAADFASELNHGLALLAYVSTCKA